MKNWEQTSINAGVVSKGEKVTIKYKSTRSLNILKITPGCAQCTTIKGYENGVLTAVYKGESIPIHLRKLQGHQTVRKVITVTYEDGSKEVLSFIVKII